MSDDDQRWEPDGPEEAAAAHGASELDRFRRRRREERWGIRQRSEAFPSRLILPPWWHDTGQPDPGRCCPWCQRPGVPAPCPECRAAREAADDPPRLWAWWAGLSPGMRRLHIAARFRTDPWSGRALEEAIAIEWSSVTEMEMSTTRPPFSGCTPDGIYWQARRQGGGAGRA